MMTVFRDKCFEKASILVKSVIKMLLDVRKPNRKQLLMTFDTLVNEAYFCDYNGRNLECKATYFDNISRDLMETPKFSHYFCGEHFTNGAWCPNCNKPLLRLLLLDSTDIRLKLHSNLIQIIPLFYCWTCNIAQNYFSYQIVSNNQIVIIDFGKGGCEVDFPYENYPTFFPGASAILIQLNSDAQKLLIGLNNGDIDYSTAYATYPDLTQARHQVGGEPLLMQRNPNYQNEEGRKNKCPRCKDKMPFLASVGNDCLDPRGISGNDYVQILFHYCRECRVVGAFQETD